MIPAKKAGADCAAKTKTVPIWSIQDPRRTAEMLPSGSEMRRLSAIATSASSSVAGKRSTTRPIAGCL
jgi:hypothetical protein